MVQDRDDGVKDGDFVVGETFFQVGLVDPRDQVEVDYVRRGGLGVVGKVWVIDVWWAELGWQREVVLGHHRLVSRNGGCAGLILEADAGTLFGCWLCVAKGGGQNELASIVEPSWVMGSLLQVFTLPAHYQVGDRAEWGREHQVKLHVCSPNEDQATAKTYCQALSSGNYIAKQVNEEYCMRCCH